MKSKNILILIILILGAVSFYSFQQDSVQTHSSLTAEQQIQLESYIKKKIEAVKREEYWNCQERALTEAIPIADSMIAEMYARDLRASDVILERPDRPDKPEVELEPFPFDSIE